MPFVEISVIDSFTNINMASYFFWTKKKNQISDECKEMLRKF